MLQSLVVLRTLEVRPKLALVRNTRKRRRVTFELAGPVPVDVPVTIQPAAVLTIVAQLRHEVGLKPLGWFHLHLSIQGTGGTLLQQTT